MKLTSGDIVKQFAAENDYSIVEMREVFGKLINFMREKLLNGDEIYLRGIATLSVYMSKPRPFYNMETGEQEMSKPKLTPRCKFTDSFRAAVGMRTPTDAANNN